MSIISDFKKLTKTSTFIVFAYALFGFIWIKYSDIFLESIVSNTETLTTLQTWKGSVFILITSFLLYILVQRNLKHQLSQTSESNQFIIDTPLPIAVVHNNGTIPLVNKAFTEHYGYKKSDISFIDEWWTKAYPDPLYRAQVMEQWKKDTTKDDNTHYSKIERIFTIRDKFNEDHEVEFFLIKQKNKTAVICKDITEQIKREEEMRHTEKMRAIGQLAGGVAHDFNNQLAAIIGFADLISEDENISDISKKNLGFIMSAAKRSADLTTQLLAYSRKGETVYKPVDIHYLLSEVLEICKRTFDKNISIITEFIPQDLYTIGDSSQLQNAFLNLALNARDAMIDGGKLTITTTLEDIDIPQINNFLVTPGKFIKLTFLDTGTGIDNSIFNKIFEPFYTTKEIGQGTGMGLAAVYGTLQNHNGAIDVSSKLSIGTKFTIYLPYTKNKPASENRDLTIKINKKDHKILIVDDEELIRRMLSNMLTENGFKVIECSSGKEAINIFKTQGDSIDLGILDMIMPEMDGEKTFVELRKLNKNLPILISSGYSLNNKIQNVLNNGANGFIEKPFRTNQLLQAVRKVLHN